MNELDSFDARLHDLLAPLCDGTLDAVGSAELESLVLSDPRAAEFYVKYLHLHVAISRYQMAVETPLVDGQQVPSPQPPFAQSLPHPVTPSPSHPVSPSPSHHFPLSSLVWSVLAAGILFAGYVAVISWNMLGKQLASSRDHEGAAVATIRNSEEVEWSRDSKSPLAPDKAPKGYPGAGGEGTAIAQNQLLSIQSGLIELELKQGTTLLIEGPADWKITGENSATLTHGKLVAKVPQQAIGFTLETPTAKITDLGTEFGVEVIGDKSEVRVIKGLVDVQNASGAGKGKSTTVKAGQSVKVTESGPSTPEVSTFPDKFKRLTKAGDKPSPDAPPGPTTGLVAYYPFDGDLQDHAADYAANSGTTADNLTMNGPSEFLAGQVARGVRLNGGFASAPNSKDVQLPPTFTIEAWIVAEKFTNDHQRLVLNWGGPGSFAYHFGLFAKQVSLFIGQQDGQLVKVQGGEFKIERWEHVAAVADGKLLRLYLNGNEVGSQSYDGTLGVATREGLGLGDTTVGDGEKMRFHGAIDELAIWNVALSPEQIASHARRGARGYGLSPSNKTATTPSKSEER